VRTASGPVLIAVASSSHAVEVARWFETRSWPAGKPEPALVSVDPSAIPEVWERAKELSGYSRPEHHGAWTSVEAPLYRVFLRRLFPRVQRAVYVDADVVIQDDVALVLESLAKPMALPISAPRSANTLKLRMDVCCGTQKKAASMLQALAQNATTPEQVQEKELLEEFQQMPLGYREFNNGVMALDLPELEKAGVFDRLEFWLRLNKRAGGSGLLDNDQHAWNLAAWQHWQDLQQDHETNAPTLEMVEALLQEEKNPGTELRQRLRRFSFLHYVNLPKPWDVDWEAVPQDALFDGRIWIEAFEAAGGIKADCKGSASLRQVGNWQLLRPDATRDEHMDMGLLYLEGSGGMGRDLAEARWRFERAAEAGSSEGSFMLEGGLEAEAPGGALLSDKERLAKLERCWELAKQRVRTHEDHQTLMGVYKMTEQEYMARKAPAMVSACYWRLGKGGLGEAKGAPKEGVALELEKLEELENIFGPPKDGKRTPPLSPRLAKWMGLVAKDDAAAARNSEPSKPLPKGPPVSASWARAALLPALLLIFGVPGYLGYRMLQANAPDTFRKGKKHGGKGSVAGDPTLRKIVKGH